MNNWQSRLLIITNQPVSTVTRIRQYYWQSIIMNQAVFLTRLISYTHASSMACFVAGGEDCGWGFITNPGGAAAGVWKHERNGGTALAMAMNDVVRCRAQEATITNNLGLSKGHCVPESHWWFFLILFQYVSFIFKLPKRVGVRLKKRLQPTLRNNISAPII